MRVGDLEVVFVAIEDCHVNPGGAGDGDIVSMTTSVERSFGTGLMAGGFIDGWRGFVLASADAYGVFLKYVWGYAARKASAERTQGA